MVQAGVGGRFSMISRLVGTAGSSSRMVTVTWVTPRMNLVVVWATLLIFDLNALFSGSSVSVVDECHFEFGACWCHRVKSREYAWKRFGSRLPFGLCPVGMMYTVEASMSTTGELASSTLTVKVPCPSRTVAGTIRLYGADSSSSRIVTCASSRLDPSTASVGWKSWTIEPFDGLDDGVVQDGDADGPLGGAGVEVQGAAGRDVVSCLSPWL